MKTKLRTLLVALTLLACLPHAEAVISATDTQITYQGMIINQLSRGSNTDDFVFTLFDTNSGGSRIAGPITNTAVAVNSNGLFTTTMNFGTNYDYSQPAWLEISVRTNGGGAFTTLTPRQRMTATPRSIYSQTAGTALSVSPTTIVQGQSLSIGVNNSATGTQTTIAGGSNNVINANFGTISGGIGNSVSSSSSTVGGGNGNTANGPNATVAGGTGNIAIGPNALVAGGSFN